MTLPRRAGIPLVIIFCLSGASALAYEVLWTRQLGLVLGGSALAISTILATYFAGLGLGGFLGGKLADRLRSPLLAYSLAELAIAAFGLATPLLLSASGTLYLGLYRLFASNPTLAVAAKALATAAILLVPTTLMGITLPLVVRFYVRNIDHVGRGLGLLYGINILGGVLGCGFVGYYSIVAHGVTTSIMVAAAVNVVAALGALVVWALARGAPASGTWDLTTHDAAEPSLPRDAHAPGRRDISTLILLAMAVSGFTSIAYEVLWTRALTFAIGNSVYAFTTILVVFLGGLFLGAIIAGPIADRTRVPLRILGIVQILAAGAMLLTFSLAPQLPALSSYLIGKLGTDTLAINVITKVVPAAVALLIPSLLLGLTFPMVMRVGVERMEKLGRRLGGFYAVNTAGSIMGSLAAGFALLPLLGIVRGMIVIAILNLGMAILFFRHAETRPWRRFGPPLVGIASVALVLAVFLVQPRPFLEYTGIMKAGNRRIIFHEEGHTATVAVTEAVNQAGELHSVGLYINLLCAASVDMRDFHTQFYVLISLIPSVLHSHPEKVFVAGLASGVTTGACALDERTQQVTCVEISPEVVHAAACFDDYSYGATQSPKIRILVDDARSYLETTEERYDVIVTDVFISALTGTAALYSQDYFELCCRRLAPGGFMIVGVSRLLDTDLTVARSFLEAFPHVAVLLLEKSPVPNPTFLLGSNQPLVFSRKAIEEAYCQPTLAAELSRYFLPTPDDLLDSYLCTGKELLPFIEEVKICTDDHPVIDFFAVAQAEGFIRARKHSGLGVRRIMMMLGGRQENPFLGP